MKVHRLSILIALAVGWSLGCATKPVVSTTRAGGSAQARVAPFALHEGTEGARATSAGTCETRYQQCGPASLQFCCGPTAHCGLGPFGYFCATGPHPSTPAATDCTPAYSECPADPSTCCSGYCFQSDGQSYCG